MRSFRILFRPSDSPRRHPRRVCRARLCRRPRRNADPHDPARGDRRRHIRRRPHVRAGARPANAELHAPDPRLLRKATLVRVAGATRRGRCDRQGGGTGARRASRKAAPGARPLVGQKGQGFRRPHCAAGRPRRSRRRARKRLGNRSRDQQCEAGSRGPPRAVSATAGACTGAQLAHPRRGADAAGGGRANPCEVRTGDLDQPRVEHPPPVRRDAVRPHVRRRDGPVAVPDAERLVARRGHAAEPVVAAAELVVGARAEADSAWAGESPRHALDGPRRRRCRHSRNTGCGVDRLLGVTRLHSHANSRR